MGNTLKKKKGFSMPHVYAVILILMLLVTIMTYVIPAGTYARVDGNVDPNSFTYVEQTPVSFLSFFTSLHQGFVESANVIGAVLLISGAIQIIQKTGAFSAGIQALIKRAKGRDLVMVLLFFTIFTGMGVIGYLDALYPFYPIIISLFITLGYDKMVGTAIIMLSTAVGFTCGMVNPYTTGVAQTLVGLPMYSGIALRAVGLVVFYAIAVFFLTRYCIKIKKNPKYSVMGENYLQEQTAPMQFEEGLDFHGRRVAIIVVFLAAIVLSVVGSLRWKWGLPEITAVYMPVAIVAVVLSRMLRVRQGHGRRGGAHHGNRPEPGGVRPSRRGQHHRHHHPCRIRPAGGQEPGDHPAHHLRLCHSVQLLRLLRLRQGRGHDAHPPASGSGAWDQSAGHGAGVPIRRRLHQHLLAHRFPASALSVRYGLRSLVQVRLENLRVSDYRGVPPDHYCKPDRLRSLLNTAWRGRRIVGAAPAVISDWKRAGKLCKI